MDYKYLPFFHAHHIAWGIGNRCGCEKKLLFPINFQQVSEIKFYQVAVIYAIVLAGNLGVAPFSIPCGPPPAMPVGLMFMCSFTQLLKLVLGIVFSFKF